MRTPSSISRRTPHRFDRLAQLVGRLSEQARAALAERLGIDPRALAALRIALGSLILLDLLLRARSIEAFYTDTGVLPRAALADIYPTISRLSLHALSGTLWWQALLFAIAGCVAVALVLGYRTRLATAASFLLLVSLHIRNPVVLNGGDVVFRRLLLWSCFLPLGRRWSVDAVRRTTARVRGSGRAPTHSPIVGVASAALLLQVVTIYTSNVLFKLEHDVWLSGSAVERALAMEQFSTAVGDLLVQLPLLPELANWMWLGLLASAPLLVLFTGRIRATHATLFAGMHVGMLVTMVLGIFPLVLVAALLVFLPPSVWAAVESRLPVQSTRREGRVARSASDGGHPSISLRRRISSQFATVVVVLLVLLATTWNLAALGVIVIDSPTEPSLSPSDHRWAMFTAPGTTDVQLHYQATLASGDRVDALETASFAPAGTVGAQTGYPTARWRKYLVSLRYDDPAGLDDDLARGLCTRVATDTGRSVESVSMTAAHQPTHVSDRQSGTLYDLGTYECGH